MKKLFTIKCDGVFWVEEENVVYSVFDRNDNTHIFFDVKGNILPDYRRKPVEYEPVYENVSEDDEESLVYNQYGVACGDSYLVDKDGNEIPDTKLNLEEDCGEGNRYFMFSMITDEQSESIAKCGTAENITVDIYDTKNREYIAKGIPECKLNLYFFDGEPFVVLEAIKLIPYFEYVTVCENYTIIAKKEGMVTVFTCDDK